MHETAKKDVQSFSDALSLWEFKATLADILLCHGQTDVNADISEFYSHCRIGSGGPV